MTASARKKNVISLAAQPTSELVTITPELAREWLGVNVNNRKLRDPLVKKYGRDMASGKFPVTGASIAFDRTGRLIDGQHRLHAIIAADVTVKSFVVRGLDPEAQDYTDIGTGRPAADILGFHGKKNASLLGATAKLAILFQEDRLYKNSSLKTASPPEILAFVEANPAIEDAVAFASSIRNGVDCTPSVLACAIYLCSQVNAEAASVFFERLEDGVNIQAGSPILALRSRLREIRINRSRVREEAKLSLIIRAWNAWRAGREMRSIPVYRNGVSIGCPRPL